MSESQRQKQKIKTRKHLIEIAMKQFAKDGLMATRTSDIAASAQVSHGTLFVHFATREILLDEVIEEFGIRIASRLHELADGKTGLKEALEAHLEGIQEYEDFYTKLISEAPMLHEGAQAYNTLIMIQSAISFHLNQIAQREMEASVILKMPFSLMFNTWLGLLHHYLINRGLFAPEGSVISRYGQQLVEHYIKLISCKEEIK